MKKLIFNLIIIALSIILIQSCDKLPNLSDFPFGIPYHQKYVVSGIKLKIYTKYSDTTWLYFDDTTIINNIIWSEKELCHGDTCKYDNLYMKMKYNRILIKEEPIPEDSSPYTVIPISIEYINTIKNISIFSNAQYNNQYPPFSLLNEIIVTDTGTTGSHSGLINLNKFIAAHPNDDRECRYFYLTEPPDSIRLHSFTVIWEDTQGNIFKDTSNPVYIKP